MALEALSTTPCNNDPFNFIFYDATLSAGAGAGNNAFFSENACPEIQDLTAGGVGGGLNGGCSAVVCKNKEEAETQRMTHIAVERNRRKQMNEHLAVLRSLMPESYVQRGDQASIVGGAIEFVKELEHLLQSLEAEKLRLQRQQQPAAADIEVTLIETHANVRILSPRRKARQLSKMVAAFQTIMCMSVLHLNVTTFDLLVLYSISAKVEGGCQLSSADEIAEAVHHILRGIEEEELTIP
nr:transcription factor bHLH71-like [Ipomoea batatas]